MYMYEIYQKPDGEFLCVGRLQDGTERWTEKTKEAAVKSLIQFAKTMNGSKITKKGIQFFRPELRTQYVPWDGK